MGEIPFTDRGIRACRYTSGSAKSRLVASTGLSPERIAETVHGYLLRFGESLHKINGEYAPNTAKTKRTLEEGLRELKSIKTASLGDEVSILIGIEGPEELDLRFRRNLFVMDGYSCSVVHSPEKVLFIEYNFERYNTKRQPLPQEVDLLNSLSISQKTL